MSSKQIQKYEDEIKALKQVPTLPLFKESYKTE